MRRTVLSMVAFAMLMGAAVAIAQDDEGAPKKAKKPKAAKAPVQLATLTLTGTIAKNDKGGFTLKTDDGATVRLPKPKAKKGEEPAVNLDDCVDAKVKLVGKGSEKGEGEKKKISLKSIDSVEKLDGDAGDADAAEDVDF